MVLHHKIKPHHHVSIWMASAMLLGSMALISANTDNSLANEPSEKTKRFFGAEGGGAKEYNPPECQQNQNDGQAQAQAYDAEMQQLNVEMSQLQAQMQQAATPEEQASIQQQMQTKQARMQELQTTMQAMQQQQSQGPSAACKKALVTMMKTEMSTMKDLIATRITPTFGKVNAAIAKIESKIPALKEAGTDPALISRIEGDIAKIKTNETILNTFFNKMLGVIDRFLAASSDPDSAFSIMEKGMGGSEGTQAANAADGLVAAFEDLEKAVDLLN